MSEAAAYMASIASNFLVTLQAAAETVAAGAGLDASEARALLAPLVTSTVQNWATRGPERALTGPVARGDEATVELQRQAVVEAAPDRLVVAATVSRAPLTGRDASGERLVSSRTRTDSVEMVLTSVDGRWLLWSWGDAGAR